MTGVLESLRLDGKVAIVTGASRGLGRAMALALAEAGADVAVAARSKPDLEETSRQIASDYMTGQTVFLDGGHTAA